MRPNLIFTGGTIITMDHSYPIATAMAVAHDRILAVGDDPMILNLAGPDTVIIPLHGRCIMPGFNDSHIHLWKEGMLLTQVNARFNQAPTIADIMAAFAKRAEQTPRGTWIEGRGYDDTRLPERRHPTRYDLDNVAPEHPVILGRTCGHIVVANSRALALANITRDTPDPIGGEIDRDEHGEPTGVLRETAMALVRNVQSPPSEEELAQALIGAGRKCNALGITAISEPGVDPRTVEVYRRLDEQGRLPVRSDVMAMTILPNGEHIEPPSPWEGTIAKCNTIKLFGDGGLSSGTAALSIPYRNRHDCGLPRFPAELLAKEVRYAYDAGLSVAVHAIGDRVIGELLDAFEALPLSDEARPTQRLRIEHLGLPTAEHLMRAKDLGVMVATQPSFLYDLGDTILSHLPDSLVPQCYPFRAMIEAGLIVGYSSDGPVISDINPFIALQSAALRTTRNGRNMAPEQYVELSQSLWCFTVGSALVSGQQHKIGHLAPNYRADFIVLSDNPLDVPIERLLEIQVHQTYVNGSLVYES